MLYTYRHKSACSESTVGRDISSGQLRLVVKDANRRGQLVDLAVVGERGDQWVRVECRAVRLRVRRVGAVHKALHELRQEGQHELLLQDSSESGTVPVADVLSVFVLQDLFFGEDITPRAALSGDRSLEAAEVGEQHDVRRIEYKSTVQQIVDAGNDGRQIDVSPDRGISSSTVIIVKGAEVGCGQRVRDGSWVGAVQHVYAAVTCGVWTKVAASEQPSRVHHSVHVFLVLIGPQDVWRVVDVECWVLVAVVDSHVVQLLVTP